MTDNEIARQVGRLEEALAALFDAIPKAKRPRLFAAMAHVETRSKHALAALILLSKFLPYCKGAEELDQDYVDRAERLLREAGC